MSNFIVSGHNLSPELNETIMLKVGIPELRLRSVIFVIAGIQRDIFPRENFGETKLTKGNIEHALRQLVFKSGDHLLLVNNATTFSDEH